MSSCLMFSVPAATNNDLPEETATTTASRSSHHATEVTCSSPSSSIGCTEGTALAATCCLSFDQNSSEGDICRNLIQLCRLKYRYNPGLLDPLLESS